jgi:tetratricopeptide (TPR) repeat protein
MAKRIFAILVASTIALAGCGGEENAANQGSAADEAYRQVRANRSVMDSPQERVAITKSYLGEYPESEHTAGAIDIVYWYQGTELDDKAGALAYAETVRAKIADPEIALDVDKLLIGYYGENGLAVKMVELADRVAEAGALDFDDHWNVIEGASMAGDWQLVRDYCARARKMTNAAALRTEYPDRDLSQEEVEDALEQRAGMLLAMEGWARAHQGELDAALADFAAADQLIPRYYFDVPEYELYIYWGRTLIMKGEFEAAIERLATQGLILRNEKALTGLREAYVGMHGGVSGYEEYEVQLHRSIARPIDDFEMADYEGIRRRFSDLRGDVTLLTLWYPT